MNLSRIAIAVSSFVVLLGACPASAQTGVCDAPDIVNNICNTTQSDQQGNTAGGTDTLNVAQDRGFDNTGFGSDVLTDTSGTRTTPASSQNTAVGSQALRFGSGVQDDTAVGYFALNSSGGSNDTAVGSDTLERLSGGTASGNTAIGSNALQLDNTGDSNTAVGFNALQNDRVSGNTGIGSNALMKNESGKNNTAVGSNALQGNIKGNGNTGIGFNALIAGGVNNTATGVGALLNGGDANTATGFQALFNNTGNNNTGVGFRALLSNTAGIGNTANGYQALRSNTTGNANTAVGQQALSGNTTGSSNIAVGFGAGFRTMNGSRNIDIGNQGSPGDNQVIRIGTQGIQRASFIAGINTSNVTGDQVMINSTGQLGIAPSSGRYKQNIRDMGDASGRLMNLRPVTFVYNQDPTNKRQFGLVAEEVERVYPELVTLDADRRAQSVQYQQIIPMLLNEIQKQNRESLRQAAEIRRFSEKLLSTQQRVTELQASHDRELQALRADFRKRVSALDQADNRASLQPVVSTR
jgi:hypothetical protein